MFSNGSAGGRGRFAPLNLRNIDKGGKIRILTGGDNDNRPRRVSLMEEHTDDLLLNIGIKLQARNRSTNNNRMETALALTIDDVITVHILTSFRFSGPAAASLPVSYGSSILPRVYKHSLPGRLHPIRCIYKYKLHPIRLKVKTNLIRCIIIVKSNKNRAETELQSNLERLTSTNLQNTD